MRQALRVGILVGLIAVITPPVMSHAVVNCKVKVIKRDGTLEISASEVIGALRWGDAAGQEKMTFFNQSTCITGGKARKCVLGIPGSVEGITPPENCRLFLADDTSSRCQPYVVGCTPGVRNISGLLAGPPGPGNTIVSGESGDTKTIAPTCTNYSSETNITVSGAHTVEVVGSTWLRIHHVLGVADEGFVAVGTTSTECDSSDGHFFRANFQIEATSATDTYDLNVPFRYLASQDGTTTYYLNARMEVGQDAGDVFSFANIAAHVY